MTFLFWRRFGRFRWLGLPLLSWLLWSPWSPMVGVIRAQTVVETHALVVGSNPGGPGQEPLRYAERDAERVAGLLVELGRAQPGAVQLLLSPDRAQLDTALAQVRSQLQAAAQAGTPTQLVFFYSGHARADALNLGDDRVPLSELRAQLLQMPATLQVVLLDACQSGAFSGIKGASPAADFSFNSMERLQTEGVAVVSSSTGTELSQESEELGSGYFTHHLLVALRGAADADRDGRVSLQETYGYVYAHTLADTSRTRVGGQHVSLERRLSGKGDVALSFPSDAEAHLALSDDLRGQLLVQQAGGGAVVAELYKRTGQPLTVALPAGRYEIVLRRDGRVYDCPFELPRGQSRGLDLAECHEVRERHAAAKGGPVPHETWYIEAGLQAILPYGDAYTDRLGVFDFDDQWLLQGDLAPRLGVGRGITRHLGIGVGYVGLERRRFERDQTGEDLSQMKEYFDWRGHALMLHARARIGTADERWQAYAQLGAGLGLVRSRYTDRRDGVRTDTIEYHLGPAFEGGLGLAWNALDPLGVFLQLGHGYAPVMDNEIGDVRDSGGTTLTFGVRGRWMGR